MTDRETESTLAVWELNPLSQPLSDEAVRFHFLSAHYPEIFPWGTARKPLVKRLKHNGEIP